MKSRSEVLAEKKKSAAERTVPMFDKKSEEKPKTNGTASSSGDMVRCEACEEEMSLAKLDKRDDGQYECMHCAAPIKVGKSETKKAESKTETKKPKLDTKSGSFCGDCGAEWLVEDDGSFVINCGHTKALRVDDPRKATKMKGATASGVPNIPPHDVKTEKPPIGPLPSVSIQGNRISIGWGKCTFPVGEARGMKYANMEIPQQIITVELPEGSDRVKAARDILAELQKIADVAFDTQFKWFCDKLKLLDK